MATKLMKSQLELCLGKPPTSIILLRFQALLPAMKEWRAYAQRQSKVATLFFL